MSELSTVILEKMVTLLVKLSRLAANRVANGGSSALLAARSKPPSVVTAISSTRVVPPVAMDCLMNGSTAEPVACRSITLRVLLPSPA